MVRRGFALVLVAALAGSGRSESYDAYAAPNTWGPPVLLKAHLGPINYAVSYRAVGKTQVVGEVSYLGPDGREVVQQFNGSVAFRTGNVAAQPTVRFKGVPFGSAVVVTTRP